MALEKIYQDTNAEAGAAALETFATDVGRRTGTTKPIEALNAALRLAARPPLSGKLSPALQRR